MQIGVYDEIDPLKTVGYWELGLGQKLNQTLPEEINLYRGLWNVEKGLKEQENLVALLNSLGIQAVNFRDVFAGCLQPIGLTSKEVLLKIEEQCKKNMEKYGRKVDISYLPMLMEKDIQKYGDEIAAALNYHLCLHHGFPLGNIYFPTDSSATLMDKVFLSNMMYEIRKPEVPIIEKCFKSLSVKKPVHITQGKFEGGDAIVFDRTVFLGYGVRTDKQGILTIYEHLSEYWEDYIFLAIKPPPGKNNENMDNMHLDTYFMPTDKDKVTTCPEVVKEAEVFSVPQFKSVGNFYDLLKKSRGYDTIHIPSSEQLNGGNNFENVCGSEVILSKRNTTTNQILENNGVKVHRIGIENLEEGYGDVHCMLDQILRGY